MYVTSYLFLIISGVVATVDEQPYCSLRYRRLCQGKGRHVACQFPVPGPSASCTNYTKIKFTSDLRSFITHYINRRRQRIAAGNERVRGGARLPKPEVMMWVNWDRELAHLAQRLADQCLFVHDECRATVRYPYAGQTVGEVRWRRSSDAEELSAQRAIRRVFDAWWGERRRVRPNQLTEPFRLTAKGNVWGHFSQLAVWTLRAVGCGAVSHGDTHTRMLLVCDFSHTNMLGQRTINPGPLAPCPVHTARKIRSAYPLLCAPVRRSKQSEPNDEYDYEEEQESYHDDGKMYTDDDEDDQHKIRIQQDTRFPMTRKTSRMVDLLEKELDRPVTKPRLREWPTRPLLVEPRYRDTDERKLAEKLQFVYRESMDDKNPSSKEKQDIDEPRYKLVEEDKIHKEQGRQKWKQVRFRPQRPGAKALLNKPDDKPIERSSMASLMIDKDGVDQIFRDTGFKMTRKKQ